MQSSKDSARQIAAAVERLAAAGDGDLREFARNTALAARLRRAEADAESARVYYARLGGLAADAMTRDDGIGVRNAAEQLARLTLGLRSSACRRRDESRRQADGLEALTLGDAADEIIRRP